MRCVCSLLVRGWLMMACVGRYSSIAICHDMDTALASSTISHHPTAHGINASPSPGRTTTLVPVPGYTYTPARMHACTVRTYDRLAIPKPSSPPSPPPYLPRSPPAARDDFKPDRRVPALLDGREKKQTCLAGRYLSGSTFSSAAERLASGALLVLVHREPYRWGLGVLKRGVWVELVWLVV